MERSYKNRLVPNVNYIDKALVKRYCQETGNTPETTVVPAFTSWVGLKHTATLETCLDVAIRQLQKEYEMVKETKIVTISSCADHVADFINRKPFAADMHMMTEDYLCRPQRGDNDMEYCNIRAMLTMKVLAKVAGWQVHLEDPEGGP